MLSMCICIMNNDFPFIKHPSLIAKKSIFCNFREIEAYRIDTKMKIIKKCHLESTKKLLSHRRLFDSILINFCKIKSNFISRLCHDEKNELSYEKCTQSEILQKLKILHF